MIKPWPLGRNPHLGNDQFHRDDFNVEHPAGTVTCPAGHTTHITAKGTATFGARCRGCPLRLRCTANTSGRTFNVGPHDALLAAARFQWRNGELLDDYRRWRPLVERSIAWLVGTRHRRVRYRGITRNRLGLTLRATAVNLRRLINLGLHHTGTTWATT